MDFFTHLLIDGRKPIRVNLAMMRWGGGCFFYIRSILVLDWCFPG